VPSTRPLPSVIGLTENALRALLIRTLASTPIGTYPAWVILNAASNAAQTAPNEGWRSGVADALKVEPADVVAVINGLRESGLLSENEALTDEGAVELARARAEVGMITSRLTDGLTDSEQETVRLVLDRIRSSAEVLLTRDA
jgi:DNA-binding MarR family transcriptional regulator